SPTACWAESLMPWRRSPLVLVKFSTSFSGLLTPLDLARTPDQTMAPETILAPGQTTTTATATTATATTTTTTTATDPILALARILALGRTSTAVPTLAPELMRTAVPTLALSPTATLSPIPALALTEATSSSKWLRAEALAIRLSRASTSTLITTLSATRPTLSRRFT
ncbi:hypothetical protein LPJ61_004173, partial [Coemansia biformis]